MAQHPRPHKVLIKLTGAERATLETQARERGTTMAAVLRGALTVPPPPPAVPTWQRALDLLAREAEAGDVRAMIALERALHPSPAPARQQPASPQAEFGLRAVR